MCSTSTTAPVIYCVRHGRGLRRRIRKRAGFSLFELLIVMAILALLSAMAVPQLMSMMRENTVFEAADKVREAMGEARRNAIETGIDYELRYEVNGSTIVVLPAELEKDVDTQQETSRTIEEYVRLSVELSETLRLQAGDGVEESVERLDPTAFGNLGGNQLAQKTWSAPLRFRFDGTTQDYEIRVTDEADLTCTVSVRGLTGSARTGQVYQEED